MKKGIIIVCLLFLIISCNTNVVEKPDNLIDKDKMEGILYDITLLEAIKNQNIKGGISSKDENEYILKKYKIDSVQLVKSTKYYAADAEEYKKMIVGIQTKLEKEGKRIEEQIKKEGKSISPNSKNPDLPQIE